MSEVSKSKIFILPTREGLIFLLIAAVLFIIALRICTQPRFFCSGNFFVRHCDKYLFYQLQSLQDRIEKCSCHRWGEWESGVERLLFSIGSQAPALWFGVLTGRVSFPCPSILNPEKGGTATITLKGERGRYRYKRMTLTTRFPFGLFRSWRNYKVSGTVHIYPSLEGKPALYLVIGEKE